MTKASIISKKTRAEASAAEQGASRAPAKKRPQSAGNLVFRPAGTGRVIKPSLIPSIRTPEQLRAAVAAVLEKRG